MSSNGENCPQMVTWAVVYHITVLVTAVWQVLIYLFNILYFLIFVFLLKKLSRKTHIYFNINIKVCLYCSILLFLSEVEGIANWREHPITSLTGRIWPTLMEEENIRSLPWKSIGTLSARIVFLLSYDIISNGLNY